MRFSTASKFCGWILAGIAAVLSFAACHAEQSRTWRASQDRGGKPGIGFEIVESESRVSGGFYILDPAHPGDFSKGTRSNMTLARTSPHEYAGSVPTLGKEGRDLVIHFHLPDTEMSRAATISMGGGHPQEFMFHPVK